MSAGRVVLHNYFRSSASWRVRIGLNLKQIPFEYVAVSLVADGGEHLKDSYAALNPLRAVPTLEIDGHALSESIAILEYLEETRPEPPILPRDRFDRAQARRIAEAVNSGMQPLQNLRILKKLTAELVAGDAGAKAFAGHFNRVGLESIEKLLEQTAGTYCVGDAISIADICLVPQLFGARRFHVDVAQFPIISRIEGKLVTHPAFEAAQPSRQPDYKA